MKFNDLKEELKIGREIEFSYKEINCSITNFDDFWYFSYEESGKIFSNKLSSFDNYDNLIKKLSKLKIRGKSIVEIFDKEEYDPLSLCIL